MRRPIIAGNWKMYKTASEAEELVKNLIPFVKSTSDVDIVVCPPFTALHSVSLVMGNNSRVELGAQDIHWEKEGAFTGEISPLMLADLKVKYVIIGHSERRQEFGETDEAVNQKVKAASAQGFIPIMCVGETLKERENGKTEEIVQRQIRAGLAGVKPEEVEKLVIAYEPIWAIGTGVAATAEDAEDVIRYIRSVVGAHFSPDVARKIRIQYGGSVKPENIAEFMREPDIDGALVGGASLDAQTFAQIIKNSLTGEG